MTKFATLKVRVPVDDQLLVEVVRDHLLGVLQARNTELLELPNRPPAEGELPGTPPPGGRIHWPAVEVVQHAERPATPARSKQRNGGRPQTTG